MSTTKRPVGRNAARVKAKAKTKAAESGVSAAQAVFARVLEKADPRK